MIRKDSNHIAEVELILKTVQLADLRMKLEMAETFIANMDPTKVTVDVNPKALGLDIAAFKNLQRIGKQESHTTIKLLLQGNMLVRKLNTAISYIDIREIIIENYIEKRKIPTKLSLIMDFEKRLTRCRYDDINHYLKKHGFIWRKLPGTKKSIVVEDPERVIERHRYFHKLQQYRNEGRPIVYIEERFYAILNGMFLDLEPVLTNTTKWYIIIATEDALINAYTYTYSPFFNYITCLNDMLIPFLPKNSVIVIEGKLNWETGESSEIDDLSSKTDIKQWLDASNVQYDNKMNKAELMILVKKFTKDKAWKLDNYFKGLGHDLLRRPKDLTNLSLTGPIGRCVKKTFLNKRLCQAASLGKELTDIIKGITKEQWRDLNERMKTEERRVYEEDILLDEVIDKLVAMTSQTDVLDEELDNYEKDVDYYVFNKE